MAWAHCGKRRPAAPKGGRSFLWGEGGVAAALDGLRDALGDARGQLRAGQDARLDDVLRLGHGHVGALQRGAEVALDALDLALDARAALAQLALDARAGLLDVPLEAVDGAAATALELLQLALGLLRRAVAAADLDDAVAGDQDGADGRQHGALDGLLRLRGDLLDLRADLGHAAVEPTLGGLRL